MTSPLGRKERDRWIVRKRSRGEEGVYPGVLRRGIAKTSNYNLGPKMRCGHLHKRKSWKLGSGNKINFERILLRALPGSLP